MLRQYTYTYSWNGSGGPYNYPADWYPMNVANYDTISITISSTEGWDGDVSFWGGAGNDEDSTALWSLVNASSNNNYDTVTNIVGATPTAFYKNYTGPVAGLAEFGVYFANPTSFESAIGTITIEVGLYASAK